MSEELTRARALARDLEHDGTDDLIAREVELSRANLFAQIAAAAALERIAAAQERAAEAAAIEAQIQLHFLEENEGDPDDIYRRIATVHSPLLSDVAEGRDEGAGG